MPERDGERIVFECPECGHINRVPRAYAGRRGRCSGCKAELRVPGHRASGSDVGSGSGSRRGATARALSRPNAPAGGPPLAVIAVGLAVVVLVGGGLTTWIVSNERQKERRREAQEAAELRRTMRDLERFEVERKEMEQELARPVPAFSVDPPPPAEHPDPDIAQLEERLAAVEATLPPPADPEGWTRSELPNGWSAAFPSAPESQAKEDPSGGRHHLLLSRLDGRLILAGQMALGRPPTDRAEEEAALRGLLSGFQQPMRREGWTILEERVERRACRGHKGLDARLRVRTPDGQELTQRVWVVFAGGADGVMLVAQAPTEDDAAEAFLGSLRPPG